jgi:hypothetical protein
MWKLEAGGANTNRLPKKKRIDTGGKHLKWVANLRLGKK